jgi:hypothetical protein
VFCESSGKSSVYGMASELREVMKIFQESHLVPVEVV